MLKLMYITNEPDIALIAQQAGVDRIFIDLETVGKAERQGGMDTVQSQHTIADVSAVREGLTQAELLVRLNPIYPGSEAEINDVIEAGADIVMLPYFKSVQQVRAFLGYVGGRAKTMLLFETPEAVEHIDEILSLEGIDECMVGLNDLHLGYGQKFMFELLADGTVEELCQKFAASGMAYGFGGIARVGAGTLPAERIIGEHVRLGSRAVILSRSFCNAGQITDRTEIKTIFETEVPKIRQAEEAFARKNRDELLENHKVVRQIVNQIVEKMG